MKTFLTILAILIILCGLGYLLRGGIEQNIVYFVTPSELLAKGSAAVGNPVRLGGMVQAESIQSSNGVTSFALFDEKSSVPVMTTKTPPQMFQAGIGVVVEGELKPDGSFEADRLMVRHGNEYRPPKEGEMPQEIYRQLRQENP